MTALKQSLRRAARRAPGARLEGWRPPSRPHRAEVRRIRAVPAPEA